MERKMRLSSTFVLQFVLTVLTFAGVHVTAVRVGYPSCKAILASNPNAPSGDYTLTTATGRTLPKVYCEMGLNGGGYTFLHPSDISQLTDAEVQAMFTDKASFLMRVRMTNGAQPYGVLKQLPAQSSVPLALFLNSNPGYATPQNSAPLGGKYLYIGFHPIPVPRGTNDGLEVNGVNVSFANCDNNPNSYFALFPNKGEAVQRDGNSAYPMFSSILAALRQNPSMRVISDDYFTFFEGHFGGCGLYTTAGSNQARYPQPDLAGNRNVFVTSMAIGFR